MKKKHQIVFITSFLILLLSSIGYGIMRHSFAGLRSSLIVLYQESADHQLTTIENNLKNTLNDKERLAKLFVKQESIVAFITEIESIMKSLGLNGEIESVAEENPNELDKLGKENIRITLSATGGWSGVAKLAGMIEKLPYKSTLDNLTISRGSGDEGGGEWNIALAMHAIGEKKPAETNTNGEATAK